MSRWIIFFTFLFLRGLRSGKGSEVVNISPFCMNGNTLQYHLDYFKDPAFVFKMEPADYFNCTCQLIVNSTSATALSSLSLTIEKMDVGQDDCHSAIHDHINLGFTATTNITSQFSKEFCQGQNYAEVIYSYLGRNSHLFFIDFENVPKYYSMQFVVSVLEGPMLPDFCDEMGARCCRGIDWDSTYCVNKNLRCDGHVNCDTDHYGDEEDCGSYTLLLLAAATLGCLAVTSCTICTLLKYRAHQAHQVRQRSMQNLINSNRQSVFSLPVDDLPPSYNEVITSPNKDDLPPRYSASSPSTAE